MASEEAKMVMVVMREDGVADLKAEYGLKIASLFAKAIVAERVAGKTTPEAENLLDEAIVAIG